MVNEGNFCVFRVPAWVQEGDESEKIAVELNLFGRKTSTPVDTAATFIWVDKT